MRFSVMMNVRRFVYLLCVLAIIAAIDGKPPPTSLRFAAPAADYDYLNPERILRPPSAFRASANEENAPYALFNDGDTDNNRIEANSFDARNRHHKISRLINPKRSYAAPCYFKICNLGKRRVSSPEPDYMIEYNNIFQ